MGNNLSNDRDCRHNGHSGYVWDQLQLPRRKNWFTFSLPQPTIHFQQKRCPHSVAQLSVLSSRHNVQFLAARNEGCIVVISSAVRSSSSAGFEGSSSGTRSSNDVTGMSSMKASWEEVALICLLRPFSSRPSALLDRQNVTRRYMSRIIISIPRSEYEGGLVWGSFGIDDN